ncbi:hypothetical protein C8R45DRAFT_914762 [Mycena sanguinolenta]|nr:hypothetical protein C8R45DRAFT_914762 [Mycena sanguinolenta]
MSGPAARDASDPFAPLSDPGNPPDLILRSSDLVDFHVHRALLSYGSVVFRNMFTFPAPSAPAEGDIMKDGKLVIPLAESSETLEKLLILCYPRSSSGFRNLDGIDGAYEAAHKYQISGGQEQLEQVLREPRFLEQQPHRVFAIACHRGLESIAKAAAMETLKQPRYVPRISVPEFKLISADRLRRLEDFHFDCGESIASIVRELCAFDEIQAGPGLYEEVWWSMGGHSADCGARDADHPAVFLLSPADWFTKHVEAVASMVSLCPDATSSSKKVAELSGPIVAAISKCPKCPTLAPAQLSYLVSDVQRDASQAHERILAKTWFTAAE